LLIDILFFQTGWKVIGKLLNNLSKNSKSRRVFNYNLFEPLQAASFVI
jgi:hypothetical protein